MITWLSAFTDYKKQNNNNMLSFSDLNICVSPQFFKCIQGVESFFFVPPPKSYYVIVYGYTVISLKFTG